MERLIDAAAFVRARDRAAAAGYVGGGDFLMARVAQALADRLGEVRRDFTRVAVLGTGGGLVARALGRPAAPWGPAPRLAEPSGAGRPAGDTHPVAPWGPAPRLAEPSGTGGPAGDAHPVAQWDPSPRLAALTGAGVLAGDTLPLDPQAHDLVLNCLLLHAACDPVGQLVQMRRALVPDGLMIAALFGGQTLAELRAALAEAEVEVTGGLSPRVLPMAEIRDLGSLLQRAGFAMPVADAERWEVTYPDPLALMRDLRAMGETNAMAARPRRPLRRETLARACALYARHFPAPGGRVRATFEVVFLTGWAPAEGQPRALRPGTATTRLADALGAREQPLTPD